MPDNTPPGRTGRPTDCTPELTHQIATYIKGGMTIREAAIRAGIHDATYRRWNREGRDWIETTIDHEHNPEENPAPDLTAHPNGPTYANFHTTVTQARAEAEGLMIGVLRRAANNGDWKAAAWWLERSLPERWGRRDHITHAGDTDQPLVINLQFDDPDPDEEPEHGPPA